MPTHTLPLRPYAAQPSALFPQGFSFPLFMTLKYQPWCQSLSLLGFAKCCANISVGVQDFTGGGGSGEQRVQSSKAWVASLSRLNEAIQLVLAVTGIPAESWIWVPLGPEQNCSFCFPSLALTEKPLRTC